MAVVLVEPFADPLVGLFFGGEAGGAGPVRVWDRCHVRFVLAPEVLVRADAGHERFRGIGGEVVATLLDPGQIAPQHRGVGVEPVQLLHPLAFAHFLAQLLLDLGLTGPGPAFGGHCRLTRRQRGDIVELPEHVVDVVVRVAVGTVECLHHLTALFQRQRGRVQGVFDAVAHVVEPIGAAGQPLLRLRAGHVHVVARPIQFACRAVVVADPQLCPRRRDPALTDFDAHGLGQVAALGTRELAHPAVAVTVAPAFDPRPGNVQDLAQCP